MTSRWQPPLGTPVDLPPPGSIVEERSPGRTIAKWLGITLIVAGVGGGGFLFVNVFLEGGRTVDGFARGPIPQATLELDGPASYTVFIEGDEIDEDDSNDDCRHCDEARAASITITGAEGSPLPLARYEGVNRYGLGGHDGVAHSTVRIPSTGTYEVTVRSSVGDEVAIGDYSFAGLFADAAIAMAVFFVGLFLGIVVLVKASRLG